MLVFFRRECITEHTDDRSHTIPGSSRAVVTMSHMWKVHVGKKMLCGEVGPTLNSLLLREKEEDYLEKEEEYLSHWPLIIRSGFIRRVHSARTHTKQAGGLLLGQRSTYNDNTNRYGTDIPERMMRGSIENRSRSKTSACMTLFSSPLERPALALLVRPGQLPRLRRSPLGLGSTALPLFLLRATAATCLGLGLGLQAEGWDGRVGVRVEMGWG